MYTNNKRIKIISMVRVVLFEHMGKINTYTMIEVNCLVNFYINE